MKKSESPEGSRISIKTRNCRRADRLSREKDISDDRLKGSVRYARVIPLGPGRTLQIEWHEEFYLGMKTAEEVTFSIEARMRRILQEAGVIK
jgi:hypothetical protein